MVDALYTRMPVVLPFRIFSTIRASLSIGGVVLAMQTTEVKQPAAAARAPLKISSLCVCPGSRKCT